MRTRERTNPFTPPPSPVHIHPAPFIALVSFFLHPFLSLSFSPVAFPKNIDFWCTVLRTIHPQTKEEKHKGPRPDPPPAYTADARALTETRRPSQPHRTASWKRTKKKTGRGKYTFVAGGYYEGEYVDGKKAGDGVMVYPDGAKYEGAFADDTMQGEGVYTYPNGDVYSGMFVAGKKSGSGSYFFKASASTFMGEWEAGEFTYGEWILKDGSTYRGHFKDGKPVGEGTYTWAKTGSVQSGSWKADGVFVGGPIVAGGA